MRIAIDAMGGDKAPDAIVAGVIDAADLLDEPDYAKRFLDDDCAPYGLELWPAAVMLAEYILQNDSNHVGRAIEIGCGGSPPLNSIV